MNGTETVQSFNCPNYSGLLYNKANTKTPFLNMISGNVKYTNSVEFVTGQYFSSEEGEIPEISETASLTAPILFPIILPDVSITKKRVIVLLGTLSTSSNNDITYTI